MRRAPARWVLAFALAGVAACASPGAGTSERSEAAPAPEVAFFDSQAFDATLSDAMKASPGVIVVRAPVAFHLNEIPERMDKWLYSVKESGGKVELRPADEIAERSVAGVAIEVGLAVYQHVRAQRTYRPARDYEAVLYYTADGTVDRVLFVRR